MNKNQGTNNFLNYYSHITRTTTWEDPRKTLAAQAAAQQQQHQSAEQLLTTHQVTQTQASSPTACAGKKQE